MTANDIARLEEDVKKLKQELATAKSMLTHNQMQIRAVINAIPVGLFITDATGKIEASNPYNLGLFRCTYQDLVGRDIQELIKSEEINRIFHSELSFEECHRQTLTAIKLDGKKFVAEIALKTFLGIRGIKYVLIVEDVSERTQAQSFREELLSLMSRDFQAPLTGVKISSEILEDIFQQTAASRSEEINPVVMQPLLNIRHSSSQMLDVVNKIIDLEQLQSENLSLRFEKVWLNLAVDQALEHVQQFALSKKIQLENKQIVCRIIADRNRVVQLLINLLTNAIRFSPGRSTVQITTQISSTDVFIAVTDSGPGVRENRREEIFKKWQPASDDKNAPKRSSGTGLGLPICKAIVEGHGGTIGVRARDGGGSVFWVRLPIRIEEDTKA